MTSPVRAAAVAASSASTALTPHSGKNKTSEQQTSADLATQAKRLKLNDGSAAAGAGAGAAAASGSVINAAHAALRVSGATAEDFTGVMNLSDFNGQIRYLGPNCLTVVLSYLQVREVHELSRQLLEAHSIGKSHLQSRKLQSACRG